jgi:acyl-coenzyme A synthetase/AMP-(fatty) acid ligase
VKDVGREGSSAKNAVPSTFILPITADPSLLLFVSHSLPVGRLWNSVDKYGITHLYTAPTAIRSLMREGDHHVTKYARTSLKVLGSVGEPINPEAWKWYHEVRGDGTRGRDR